MDYRREEKIAKRKDPLVYKIHDAAMSIKMEMFALNRHRLVAELERALPDSIVLLKGGVNINHYNTDTVYTFRQESYFHWAFGVREPGFWGAIDVPTGKSYLFIPKLSLTDIIFMGPLDNIERIRTNYGVDEVHYTSQIAYVMAPLLRETVLILKGENFDTKLILPTPQFMNMHLFNINDTILHDMITELRVIKTPYEIDLIRYANQISSDAHKFVMKRMRPGLYEFQAEALFLHYIYFVGGCRSQAYTCVCSSGPNAAILHYGHAAAPNNRKIADGDLCLFDMGATYYGYTSDVTVTFPANGKFTEKQKIIYTGVLKAQNVVLKNVKEGVMWTDMHRIAQEEIFQHLKDYRLLKGEISDMLKDGVGTIFQPHGIGHLLGVDTHDVGGYTSATPKKPTEAQYVGLRTARKLKAGMVLTVEPGCYFIDKLLDDGLKNPLLKQYLEPGVLNEYRGIGGVRLEDVILITETGYEKLTNVPRTIEEIEEMMSAQGKIEAKILEIHSQGLNDAINLADKIQLLFKDEISKDNIAINEKKKKREHKKKPKPDDWCLSPKQPASEDNVKKLKVNAEEKKSSEKVDESGVGTPSKKSGSTVSKEEKLDNMEKTERPQENHFVPIPSPIIENPTVVQEDPSNKEETAFKDTNK